VLLLLLLAVCLFVSLSVIAAVASCLHQWPTQGSAVSAAATINQ